MTDRTLEALLDKQEITEVIYRYCRGIDRFDFELVKSCYHDDAMDRHPDYHGGIDGFCKMVETLGATNTCTHHFIGNILIELDGDVAHVESYAVMDHVVDAHGPIDGPSPPRSNFKGAGRYIDRFERREDRVWRIAERNLVMSYWYQHQDLLMPDEEEPPHRLWARRDRSDLAYCRDLEAYPFVAPADNAGPGDPFNQR